MTPILAARSRRRAQQTLERDYERLRSQITRALSGRLAARGIRYDLADLDAFYNQAWHALFDRLAAGEEIESTTGFLAQVAFRRAIDDFRSLHPDQRDDNAQLENVAVEPDLVAELDDKRRIREFLEATRDRLDERQRAAAMLCYVHGYTRPEAAQLLGVNERRMQKIMDEVSQVVGAFGREISEGTWCDSRTSLMKAYALGLLDPEGDRHGLAVSHLRECSSCRAFVLRLRGLAAALPPIGLPWGGLHLAGVVGGGHAVASASKGSGPRVPRPSGKAAAAGGVAIATAISITVGAVALTSGHGSHVDRPKRAAAGAGAPAASAAPASRRSEAKPSHHAAGHHAKRARHHHGARAAAASVVAGSASSAPVTDAAGTAVADATTGAADVTRVVAHVAPAPVTKSSSSSKGGSTPSTTTSPSTTTTQTTTTASSPDADSTASEFGLEP